MPITNYQLCRLFPDDLWVPFVRENPPDTIKGPNQLEQAVEKRGQAARTTDMLVWRFLYYDKGRFKTQLHTYKTMIQGGMVGKFVFLLLLVEGTLSRVG